MLNVIRMDIERMRRTKSTYIMLLVVLLVSMLNVFMLSFEQDLTEELGSESYTQQQQQEMINLGITVQLEGDEMNLGTAVLSMCTSGFILLFTGIYIALYVVGESSSGYIKNIASSVNGRWKLIISKNVVMTVFLLLEFLTLFVGTAIGIPFFVEEPSFLISSEIMGVLALQLMLHIGYAAFGILIAIWLRSKAMSMITLILIATGFGTLIVSLLELILEHSNIVISNYLLSQNIMMLGTMPSTDNLRRILLVFFVGVLVYNVCSVMIMEKRDIR